MEKQVNFDSTQYLRDIQNLLSKKRENSAHLKDYRETLINSVNYYNILNHHCRSLVEKQKQTGIYLTEMELSNKIQDFQLQAHNIIPSLLDSTDEFYRSKYQTESPVLKALEFDYVYRKMENTILTDVLSSLQHEEVNF